MVPCAARVSREFFLTSPCRRPAFSLVELMIAIVILGLGLLVVATMFPIAWMKARDLAEYTTSTTCTDTAVATVRLLTVVSADLSVPPNGVFDAGSDRPSSFLGDVDKGLDPWVHALHEENIVADAPQALLGNFLKQEDGSPIDPYAPVPPWDPAVGGFGAPGVQIPFHERIHPPLTARPTGTPPPPADLAQWENLFSMRRFGWSVLYKFDFGVSGSPVLSDPRTLTLYVLTLRRGQTTHRYARQDPAFSPPYGPPASGDTPVAPQALPDSEDVLFPVPWRVQIALLDPSGGPPGVPTEAWANTDGSGNPTTNRLVPEMMPRGAVLIDELNGNLYRVAQREFDPTKQDPAGFPNQAVLTFDRHVPAVSLEHNGTDGLQPEELLRTVWVFPPAVEKARAGDDLPLYTAPQPVAGVELRTIVLTP